MSDIEHSDKYLALQKIPIVSDQTPLNEVFSQLDQQNTGGFLVQSATADEYKNFIIAKILAQAALNLVKQKGQSWIRNKVLADILEKPEAKSAVFNLDHKSLSISMNTSELNALDQSIFLVKRDEKTTGILFNEETAITSIQTSPPKYVCKNRHSNPSLGDGYCDLCSEPLEVA